MPAAAGSGSPPATPTPETPAAAAPVQTPGGEAPASGATPAPEADDEPEVPADEQANWTEGEKKLYGALQKERTKRKEARAKNRELEDRLQTLETRLNTPPAQPEPSAPTAAPAAPVASPILADCNTLEAVEARATQAATTEAQVLRMQNALHRQGGREAVIEQLTAQGVREVGGTPIADATEEHLGDFLVGVYEGARMTQMQAEPRKRFLFQQAASWEQATKDMPELRDPKSARAQAAREIIAAAPWLQRQGPNWPAVLVTQILGQEARAAKAGPAPRAQAAPATPAATPSPAPAAPPAGPVTRPLPGTPTNAAAALPQTNEYDAASARVRNGSASLADVQLMAKAAITQNNAAQPAR